MTDKYTKYSIFIIVVFSIIVLSLTSMYHVSGDGCWHINAGRFIAKNGKIPLSEPLGRDEPFWSPPLYHILAATVYYILSIFNSDVANFGVKFISPIFGILSLIFSFFVIKQLINPKIAFYSTVFLAFIPIFMDYSILSYVEGMLVFFVILSVYFLINDKVVLSGTAVGLAILTKYNGVFIIPALIYILYKKSKDKNFYKKCIIIIGLPLLIASPWFIRNWLLLGNPIWPFLDFIFNGSQKSEIFDGFESKSYTAFDLTRLVHYNLFLSTYFGIFGVPDGNYSTFLFFNMPYFEFLLAIWLIGTVIFVMPLIMGFLSIEIRSKNVKVFIFIWVLSYILLFLLYVVNVGFSVSRIVLPAFPALAIFWAFGFERIKKNKNLKKSLSLFILVIVGFIIIEIFRIVLAANAWDFYKEDFDWVKSKTNPSSIFIANGQCIPYNIERISLYATEENLNKADYIWVNQNFKLDRRSILGEQTLRLVQSKNYKIAYSSEKTETIIYSIKQ